MFCKKCGFDVTDGEFCPNCGTAVEKEDAQVKAVEETVETTVDIDDTMVEDTVATDPGKGKGKAALILGIVSIALSTVCSLLSCGLTSVPAIVTSIIGMILGSSAKKLSANAGYTNKNAKIGFILSLVVLILGIIGTIVGLIFAAFGGGMSMMANGLASTTPTYYY